MIQKIALIAAFFALGTTTFGSPPPNKAGSFLDELKAEKAYILDIRYGHTDKPFSEAHSSSGRHAGPAPTAEFLDEAWSMEIRIDAADTGVISSAGTTFGYELYREDDRPFLLKFAQVSSDGSGSLSIQGKAVLSLGEWTVLGGTGRVEMTGNIKRSTYVYTVARIREP